MVYRMSTFRQRINLVGKITLIAFCLAATRSYSQVYSFTTIDVPGASSTFAQGINNSGQVVGGYTVPPPDQQGRQATNVFVLSNGNFSTFSFPGAFFSVGEVINNSGKIVGVCQAEFFGTLGQCQDFFGVGNGWVDSGGSFSTVSFPGAIAFATDAKGVNDNDVVVGEYENPDGSVFGYVLSGGSYTTVNPLNSVGSSANGINNSGHIVGFYCQGNCTQVGYLQSGGSITTLSVPGASATVAVGVNNSDTVVGFSRDSSGRFQGFVWKAGQFTMISHPLAVQGTFVNGINDAGEIAGSYVDGNGVQHGFSATPGGSSFSCPVQTVVTQLNGSSLTMEPTGLILNFIPPAGLSLNQFASQCGFTGFDWVQLIDQWPGPSNLFAELAPTMPIIIVPPQPPQNDPAAGGYTYLESRLPPFAGAFPFYYNPQSMATNCAVFVNGNCAEPIINNQVPSVTFFDAPTNSCLPGGAFSGNPSDCQGPPTSPPFMSFTTQLVGICNGTPSAVCSGGAGQPSLPLYQLQWIDDFNGTTGGIPGVHTASSSSPDPGSGTGGITITNLNGVPQTPPTISCAADTNVLWPPNGKQVAVAVSGTVTPGTSAIAAASPAFRVIDSEGQVQPSGPVTIQSDGTYSITISLVASREGTDKNGRQYTIVVATADNIGNVGSCSTLVTVPHDQGN